MFNEFMTPYESNAKIFADIAEPRSTQVLIKTLKKVL